MSDTLKIIQEMRDGKLSPDEAVDLADNHANHIGNIDVASLRIDHLGTGFPSLDKYFLFPRNRSGLVVVGARPGHGKSAFMFQIAFNVAKEQPVLIYSLEMDEEQILTRMLAADLNVSSAKIMRGEVPIERLRKAQRRYADLGYYIDDRPRIHINELRNSAVRFSKTRKPALIVVDYLQLVRTNPRSTRDQEIGDITGELLAISKECNCPVLTASQLNRGVDARGHEMRSKGKKPDYRPALSDLRESGNIEADATAVIGLSRPSMYDGYRPGEADIGLLKNRHGPIGDEVFQFSEQLTKFFDPGYKEEV